MIAPAQLKARRINTIRGASAGIQDEARQQILAGQTLSGTQRLEELNRWLKENGQFDSFGVDMQAFVAEVSATATAEAVPSPTVTPEQ